VTNRLRIEQDDLDDYLRASVVEPPGPDQAVSIPPAARRSGLREVFRTQPLPLPSMPDHPVALRHLEREESVVSVERVVRSNGEVVWRVRWREGQRNRSKVLGRKRDADAFDAEVRRRQRTGELRLIDGGKETLNEYVEQTWAHATGRISRPRRA